MSEKKEINNKEKRELGYELSFFYYSNFDGEFFILLEAKRGLSSNKIMEVKKMKTENVNQEQEITKLNRNILKISDRIDMFFMNFYEHRKIIKFRIESNELLISKLCANLEMVERMCSILFNWWSLKIGKEERMLLYPYLGKDAEIPDMFLEQKTQIEENCMYKNDKND